MLTKPLVGASENKPSLVMNTVWNHTMLHFLAAALGPDASFLQTKKCPIQDHWGPGTTSLPIHEASFYIPCVRNGPILREFEPQIPTAAEAPSFSGSHRIDRRSPLSIYLQYRWHELESRTRNSKTGFNWTPRIQIGLLNKSPSAYHWSFRGRDRKSDWAPASNPVCNKATHGSRTIRSSCPTSS